MATLTQNSSQQLVMYTWYGTCSEDSCESFPLREHEDIILSATELSDTGIGAVSYRADRVEFLNKFTSLECGHAYRIVLKQGTSSLDVPNLVISGTEASQNYGMITDSCEIPVTPTPVAPTPTPVAPTPTPTPEPIELQFRWKLIDGREVLQIKNVLKPTHSNFGTRDTFADWSTLYAFTASADFYSLDHDSWPDAAVAVTYDNIHGSISFDGLNFSLGNVETANNVSYKQILFDDHSSDTEYLPGSSVSQPAPLFIFKGDNTDPNNSALMTNSAWPVIVKKLEPTPTPTQTPTPVAPTPTPTQTPTPVPFDCCDGKPTSVVVTNGQLSSDNNVSVSTQGKNFNDPTWDGTMCWETLTSTSGKNSGFTIELRDTENGSPIGYLMIATGIVYQNESFAYTLNSNGKCYTGPMVSSEESSIPNVWLPIN